MAGRVAKFFEKARILSYHIPRGRAKTRSWRSGEGKIPNSDADV